MEARHTGRVLTLRRYALLLGLLLVPVLLAMAAQALLSRPGPPELPEDAAAAPLNVQEPEGPDGRARGSAEQGTPAGASQPAVSAADLPLPPQAAAVESHASRPSPQPAPPAQSSSSAGSSSTSPRSRTVQRPVTSRPAPAPADRDDDDEDEDDDDDDDD